MAFDVLANKRNLSAIVEALRRGRLRVGVLFGAGVSVPSGIPDFRSPGGLYATLNPDLLTATFAQREQMRRNPTAVVHIDLFSQNQFPYLEVRRPFILGTAAAQWKGTTAHYFVKLLSEKGLLHRHYTQNIDGLDLQPQVPPEKMVHVHGSLAKVACEACGAPYPTEQFIAKVTTNIRNIYDSADVKAPQESTNILCEACGKPQVKPETVLYGTSLPSRFHTCMKEDFPSCIDLLIVAGTSLTVFPASNLLKWVRPGVPRLLIDRSRAVLKAGVANVLDFSASGSDAFLEADVDTAFIELARLCDWLPELIALAPRMCPASQEALARSTPLL